MGVCLTCGDQGDRTLLIYCRKCRDSAVHHYCLESFSPSDDDIHWLCWDCAPIVEKVESFRRSERINLMRDKAVEVRINWMKKLSRGNSYEAKELVQTNDVKPEASKLKGNGSLIVAEMKSSYDGKMEPMDKGSKFTLEGANNSQEKFKKVELHVSSSSSKTILETGSLSPQMLKQSERDDLAGKLTDRMKNMKSLDKGPRNKAVQKRRMMKINDSSSSEGGGPLNVEVSSLDSQIHADPAGTSPFQLPSEPESQMSAEPIKDPIWRGRFNITREKGETNLGILAHLSSKACSRVSDAAVLLPPQLHVEVLAKCKMWPKSFKNWPPTDASIALYFFPEYERDENVFDSLLDETIEGDLSMKVVINDLELLIFSSRELPLEHWRFSRKYFLWGVFRQKSTSVRSLPTTKPDGLSSRNESATPSKQTEQLGSNAVSSSEAEFDTLYTMNCHDCSSSNQHHVFFPKSANSSQNSQTSNSCNVSKADDRVQTYVGIKI